MPHVGAERLRVQSSCDSDARVGVPGLMETEVRKSSVLPTLVRAPPENARVDGPVASVRAREQEPLGRMIEESQMIGEQAGQLFDDRNLPRLSTLDRHEFLGAAVPTAMDV